MERQHCWMLGLCLAGAGTSPPVLAQVTAPPPALYVFVSSSMPRPNLLGLARDAVRARASLVLRGFAPQAGGLQALQQQIRALNAQCCAARPASWQIDPLLFERFRIQAAPSFVLDLDGSGVPPGFAAVSGDMELANALKFMAQGAATPALRAAASAVYQSAFAQP